MWGHQRCNADAKSDCVCNSHGDPEPDGNCITHGISESYGDRDSVAPDQSRTVVLRVADTERFAKSDCNE